MSALGLGLGLPFARQASSGGSSVYDWATLFTGKKGFVFDSLQSDVTKTGGAAAANGDPIASVTDAAGTAQTMAQATGANQPTLAVTNGVGAIQFGAGDFLEGTMASEITSADDFSAVLVIYNANTTGTWYPYVFDASGLDYLSMGPAVASIQRTEFRYGNDVKIQPALNPGGVGSNTGPFIVVFTHAGTTLTGKVYDTSGTLIDTATATVAKEDLGTALKFNYSSADRVNCEVALLALISKDVTGDLTGLLSYISSGFGGWR